MESYSFNLKPSSPFRLDYTVWALRRRPDNIIDRWDGQVYKRVMVTNSGEPFEVSVFQIGLPTEPVLNITINSSKRIEDVTDQVISSLERLLGIHIDLEDFYRLSAQDLKLDPIVNQFKGFKPPRYQSYFETLVNAISCQQLTLTMGIRLLNSLAETYGRAFQTDSGIFYSFPRPQDLAIADLDDLRQLKFSYQKARYITGLSQILMAGQLNLSSLESLNDQQALERLLDLKGIGRWTAEYFLLRGLGRTHIFPADDVGARNHLESWLGIKEKLNYSTVHDVIEPWKNHGGLVYFHLLLKSLSEKDVISQDNQV